MVDFDLNSRERCMGLKLLYQDCDALAWVQVLDASGLLSGQFSIFKRKVRSFGAIMNI